MQAPSYEPCYGSSHGVVGWAGRRLVDAGEFRRYLAGPVRDRVTDKDQADIFQADLRALATTGMATDTVSALLRTNPSPAPWEVGEALVECLLADTHGAQWPWNTERDKRTPRASLPGADLVGFIQRDGAAHLVLGEVKTWSDPATPPQTDPCRASSVIPPRPHRSMARSRAGIRTMSAWILDSIGADRIEATRTSGPHSGNVNARSIVEGDPNIVRRSTVQALLTELEGSRKRYVEKSPDAMYELFADEWLID